MNEFEKMMSKYWDNQFPNGWSFIGSPEEAAEIPDTHKDQIHFLNHEGTTLVKKYFYSTGMGDKLFIQKPFEGYFSRIERRQIEEVDNLDVKKWLYNRGIPFDRWVFADNNRSGQGVMLTWKMVIKYWEGLFYSDDVLISDSTLEWGLYYFHHDVLFFGDKVNYDRAKAEELELIKAEFLRKAYSR